MADRDDLQKIAEAAVIEYVKRSEADVQKGRITESDLLKELNDHIENVEKIITNIAKEQIADDKNKDNLIKNLQTSVVRNLEKQGIIPMQQKQSFFERIGFKENLNRDDMATQYRARQMAGGIEAILEGRFASGLRQLGSTIPKVANFMGGPLYAAMSALGSATIKAVDAITKFSAESVRLSGSAWGTKISDKYQRLSDIYNLSMMYGQNKEDFDKFMMTGIGNAGRQKLWTDRQFANTFMSTRADFERMGITPEHANTLMLQQLSIGRSSDDMRKFNYRLRETTKTMDKFSGEKFISAYEELNKTFIANNINGMASAKMFAKFQDELNKGTLSVADFTRGLTNRRGAETSTLAGIGAMLAERGLGGKELQKAYSRGDMIAVAGIVRRGGQQMQRDIEKIAPEMSKQFGTSDWREALALQSGTPWGQLIGDLKNIQVQKILTSGGTLAIGTEENAKHITPEELKNIEGSEKDLIDETTQLTGTFKLLGQYIKSEILGQSAEIEKSGWTPLLSKAALLPMLGPATIPVVNAIFKIGSQDQTPQ